MSDKINIDLIEMSENLKKFMGTFEDLPKNLEAAMVSSIELGKSSGAPALVKSCEAAEAALPEMIKNFNDALELMQRGKVAYDKLAEASGY